MTAIRGAAPGQSALAQPSEISRVTGGRGSDEAQWFPGSDAVNTVSSETRVIMPRYRDNTENGEQFYSGEQAGER